MHCGIKCLCALSFIPVLAALMALVLIGGLLSADQPDASQPISAESDPSQPQITIYCKKAVDLIAMSLTALCSDNCGRTIMLVEFLTSQESQGDYLQAVLSAWHGTGLDGSSSQTMQSQSRFNQDAKFVVYINQKYNKDSAVFPVGGASAINVEIENYDGPPDVFTLTQRATSDSGSVKILNSDGTPAEPTMCYYVAPGSVTAINATGLSGGVVEISAEPLPAP